MSWEDIMKIVAGLIISIGGAGGIMLKLSSFFGNMWANKHLEKIKKNHQMEIEQYKNQLDILKESSFRYSSRQFELYNTFWHSLYDLKVKADVLWEEASQNNLSKFKRQLKQTIDEIEKSSLFIEENHYKELKLVLQEFSNYRIGKSKLIRCREKNTGIDQINGLIESNRQNKKKYENLIETIKTELRSQIKGKN